MFLSSHLMSEMAQTADHIIVLGRGRVIADAPVGDIVARASGGAVTVRTPDAGRLTAAVIAEGGTVTDVGRTRSVIGLPAPRIGELAARGSRLAARDGIVLHELSTTAGTLEEAYLALTQDDVEYHAGSAA